MGPSVSFPLPPRIAQKLPIRNSWELINKKLPIPLPIFCYFELIREVLANTWYKLWLLVFFGGETQGKTLQKARKLSLQKLRIIFPPPTPKSADFTF